MSAVAVKAKSNGASAKANGASVEQLVDVAAAPQIRMLPVVKIDPAPDNPRRDVGDVAELAESIRAQGILQPLIVVANGGGRFMAVVGHRRLAAAKLAGLVHVPAIVRDYDDRGRVEAMLVENLQRTDLSPLEEAESYRTLEQLGVKQRDLATRVGRSQAHVSKRLALLKLPEKAQTAIDSGGITIGDALELARLVGVPHVTNMGAVVNDVIRWGRAKEYVDDELRKAKLRGEEATLRAELEAKKARIVEAPAGWFDARSVIRRLGAEYNDLKIDKRKHAKEPCHGVCLDREWNRKIEAVAVCTDVLRHGPKGESALKGEFRTGYAGGGAAPAASNRAEEMAAAKRKAKAEREAKQIRLAALPAIARAMSGSQDGVLLLARNVLNHGYLPVGQVRIAAAMLGLDPKEADLAALRKFGAGSELSLRLVAVALVLAEGEEHVQNKYRHDDVDYLNLLEKNGVELAERDRKSITSRSAP